VFLTEFTSPYTQTTVAGLVQLWTDGKDVTILREVEGSYVKLNVHG